MNGPRIPWNRWVTLTGGVYVMLCAGNVFSFGSISDEVSSRLAATEEQKQLISVAGNVGLWTNVVGGLVFDHFGPSPTILAGTLMAATGYLCMCLALTHRWHPLAAALAWGLVGHGSGWLYISVLFANVKNFAPAERGYVIGIMSCFFGVSAAVMVAILDGCIGGSVGDSGDCYGGFLGGNVTHFMGFLAVAVSVAGVAGALVTHVDPSLEIVEQDCAARRFRLMTAGVLSLVIFICAGNAYALAVSPGIRTWVNYITFLLLALFVALPSFASTTPVQAQLMGNYRQLQEGSRPTSPTSSCPPASSQVDGLRPKEVVALGHFWALWLVFGTTVGTYIATLNNLVTIALSRDLGPLAGHLCVILATGSDTLSRFAAGYSVGCGVSGTKLLCAGPLLACLGQLLLMQPGGSAHLCLASVLLGLADGIMWSLGPLITGKSFGLRAAGQNFGLVVLSAATFALLLLLGLEPVVYNEHLRRGEKVCQGVGCFQLLHIVSAMTLVVSLALTFCIHSRQQSMEDLMRSRTAADSRH